MNFSINEIIFIEKRKEETIRTFSDLIHLEPHIRIGFFFDKGKYVLIIYEKKDKIYPKEILHMGKVNDVCPYCRKGMEMISCEILKMHLNELFIKVIHHPKVRLRLLFLKKY